MGAIDDFLDRFDPDGRVARPVDPDDAALAALEERFLAATQAVVTPVLSQDAREEWRGRRSAQLAGLLSASVAGLARVPALAQRLGLSGDEVNHAVEADAAACGYIKVLEAVHDGADCGALLLAEQAQRLIRETLDALARALPGLPGPARQSVSACFSGFQLAYETAQARGEAAQSRAERAVQPLADKVQGAADRQQRAQAVRAYLEDLKQRGAAPAAEAGEAKAVKKARPARKADRDTLH